MKLEHQHHQQHEAGTSTSSKRSWNNIIIINIMMLEHQHRQQHEAGTSTSICGNKMRQVHQHLWYSNRPSLLDLRDLPMNHKIS
jgi:hypothetical protein